MGNHSCYGNRISQSQNFDAPPTNSVSVDATTNHINTSGYAYDANGNMTNDGNNTLVYDAENRVLSATNGGASGTYSYDGNSLRVKKVSGSTTTIYIFSGTKVIAEYSGTSSPYPLAREYIYSGGALLAKIESGATKYYHQDHLSNRVVTDSSGNKVAEMGHYPFGESWYNAANDKLLFTSYERDAESGNDYAMIRSYVNRLARFSSVDLLPGSIGDPQSLNRYSYSGNDPANLVDPSGLHPFVQQPTPILDLFGGAALFGNDIFDIIQLAFTPTISGEFYVQGYYHGEPFSGTMNITFYGNMGLLSLLDPFSPGDAFKQDFYDKYAGDLNKCLPIVFAGDYKAGKVPNQNLGNSPTLDTSKTGDQLLSMCRGADKTVGCNNPSVGGPNGTIYIASEKFNQSGANALVDNYGSYVHELGNILDARAYPGVPPGPYPYESHHSSSHREDQDTGQNLEDCFRKAIQAPQ